MNWPFRTLSTSVGKKQLMAVTGLLFLLFLATHLLGNLSVYGGGASFVAYAEHLHALGNLLVAAEVMMARGLDHPCLHRGVPVLPEPQRPAGQVCRGQERRRPHLQLPGHALYRPAGPGVHRGPPGHLFPPYRRPDHPEHLSDRRRRLLAPDIPGDLSTRCSRGRLSCPAWSLERLSDGGGQSSQVYAFYSEAEPRLCRDRGARLRFAAASPFCLCGGH